MANTHIAWPHTDNMSAVLVGDPYFGERLKAVDPVFVTEKLDGSNLSVRVKRIGEGEDAQWALLAIQGRNGHLWEPDAPWGLDAGRLPIMKYGNAGCLDTLPAVVFRYAVAVATELGEPELIMFGEAFRGPRQPKASFHPFGCMVWSKEDGAKKTLWLTPDLHRTFTKFALAAPPVDLCGTAFQAYLRDQKDVVVCAPPILFHGPLMDAIDHTKVFLKDLPQEVEGAFFTGRGVCCKWKSAHHEEQQNPPRLDELAAFLYNHQRTGKACGRTALQEVLAQLEKAGLVDKLVDALPPLLVRAFQHVRDIFPDRVARWTVAKPLKMPKEKAPEDPSVVAARMRAVVAFERERTKEPALDAAHVKGLAAADRKKLADAVVPRVVAEVAEQIEADGEAAVPAAVLTKLVSGVVMPPIMKGKLDGL